MKYSNKKAFTLVELLVVIAIIGLLSTIAVVSLGGARIKAKDAKRIADLRSMQTALETALNSSSSINWADGSAATTTMVDMGYLTAMPIDPLSSANNSYVYCADGGKYVLAANLEAPEGLPMGVSKSVVTEASIAKCKSGNLGDTLPENMTTGFSCGTAGIYCVSNVMNF